MKKLAFILTICLVTVLVPFSYTANAKTEGYYTYDIYNGQAAILYVDSSISNNATIPSTLGGYPVTMIEDFAFSDCTKLTNITIPDSVKFIGDAVFNNTAYYNNSSNWKNGVLYIGDFLIEAKSLSGSYSIKSGTKTIASGAFQSCKNLTNIDFPESVVYICDGAFAYCNSLTNVTIGCRVTFIGWYAFMYCKNLKNITIPESVTCIDADAFDGCTNLTDAYFQNTNGWSVEDYYNGVTEISASKLANSKTAAKYLTDDYCGSVWTCNEVPCKHDYGDKWFADNSNHWQKCSKCGEETERASHNFVGGTCSVCGINPNAITVGDLDDGVGVDANDAIYLLYNVFFGPARYPVNQSCDFDGNGAVEASDAIYLLYHVFFGSGRYPLK